MAWYDLFSRVYDTSLEPLYREHRRLAVEALHIEPGMHVLDLPCGTGQSLTALAAAVGPHGRISGVDLSPGMLRQARARVAREQLATVTLLQADAAALEPATLGGAPDRLLVFLGMTVFTDHEALFTRLWSLLAPGGRCVLVDVHAEAPGLQGKLVQLIARADLRRRFWEPLERVAIDFERLDLPYVARHGGQIMLAVGDKPE